MLLDVIVHFKLCVGLSKSVGFFWINIITKSTINVEQKHGKN